MVPLVEKAAEHITAVDEAYDDNMNSALAHVLGSSIQTALLNTPLVVLVGWGMNVRMDLNFPIFDAAALILAIIVVGNFLRDGKSNYLEGALCVIVYLVGEFHLSTTLSTNAKQSLALAAFYYPNAHETGDGSVAAAHKVGPATATITGVMSTGGH
jgi:Ca2+:H+ antiporter